MKFIKELIKCLKSDEYLHEKVFSSKDEFVEFDADAFKDHFDAIARCPHIYEARYDKDGNRVWGKDS